MQTSGDQPVRREGLLRTYMQYLATNGSSLCLTDVKSSYQVAVLQAFFSPRPHFVE